MAKCAYCGSTIVIGGKRQGDFRFCNDKCLQRGVLLSALDQVPKDLLERYIHAVHRGNCPKCKGNGPVDVHTSYSVWSILVLTSWRSTPQICCKKCGIKAKVRDGFVSLLIGWWGVPWGIILTPVQVVRNFAGIFYSPDPSKPSKTLETMVGLDLAAKVVQAQAQGLTQQTNSPYSRPVSRVEKR